MSNLFVHMRMKECCRRALKELDRRKRKIRSKAGLFASHLSLAALGELAPDVIRNELASMALAPVDCDDDFARTCRDVCKKIAGNHAKEHRLRGELAEAGVWELLEARF